MRREARWSHSARGGPAQGKSDVITLHLPTVLILARICDHFVACLMGACTQENPFHATAPLKLGNQQPDRRGHRSYNDSVGHISGA
jgi:hypothetical protein